MYHILYRELKFAVHIRSLKTDLLKYCTVITYLNRSFTGKLIYLLRRNILLPGFVVTRLQTEGRAPARALWKPLSVTSSCSSCALLFFFQLSLPRTRKSPLFHDTRAVSHHKFFFGSLTLSWFIHPTSFHSHPVDWAPVTAATDRLIFFQIRKCLTSSSVCVIRTRAFGWRNASELHLFTSQPPLQGWNAADPSSAPPAGFF